MKYAKSMSIYVIIFAFIILAVIALKMANPLTVETPYSYSDLVRDLEANRVKKVELIGDPDTVFAATAAIALKTGDTTSTESNIKTVEVLDVAGFMEKMNEYAAKNTDLVITTKLPPKTNALLSLITPFIFLIVAIFIMVFMVQTMQGAGGNGRGVMNFGKSKARVSTDEKKRVTFEQVAGLDEEKAELAEIVEFLKAPKKFTDIGARIPKGVLLVGPPGTGKTYLARACAGEAGVPFFSISGSDFVEMFVGVGASRVRDLFEQAKKNSPCIIFIDEIDAVGRRRGAGLGGGHDEREQTLNQLLVEMDGFGVNEGIIIVAATNRPDILDPALLRPGRFDRQVTVGIPDAKGREGVLRVHAKGKQIAAEVDLRLVAQTTPGFTPADLENLLNEAALLAARHDKTQIDMTDLRQALIKVGVGTEKKSRVVSDRDRRITAYHEAGHAILHEVLPQLEPVHIVSVIPTGRGAAGYTMWLPGDDNSHITKKFLQETIVAMLGGRAAEFLVIEDITTGASNDIERATKMARNMVTKFGMSDVLGPIQFGDDNDEVFIGRDLAHSRNYGEGIASMIDSEIKRIVDDAYREAIEILRKYMDIVHSCAELLIKNEKITGDEFRALFGDNLPDKLVPRKVNFMAEPSIDIAPELPNTDTTPENKGGKDDYAGV